MELDSKEYKDLKKTISSPPKKEKKYNNSTGIVRVSKGGKSIIESDDTFSDKKNRAKNFLGTNDVGNGSLLDESAIELGTIAIQSPSQANNTKSI